MRDGYRHDLTEVHVTPRLSARVLCALALSYSFGRRRAATDADLAEIREQIRSLKEAYEARIQALEQRLKDAEAAAAAPPRRRVGARARRGTVRQHARRVQSRDLGRAAGHLRAPLAGPEPVRDRGLPAERRHRPGPARLQPRRIGAGFFANVDDKFAGNLIVSLTPDNTVVGRGGLRHLMTGAPYGLAPKFGRFFSGIGYLNEQHQHAWDFYDAPLAYQAFLGGQYAQRRRAGEMGRADRPVPRARRRGRQRRRASRAPRATSNGVGVVRGRTRTPAATSATSHSWRAGLSYLRHARRRIAQYTQPDVAGNDAQLGFTGKSQLAIADFVWKYAPNGNAHDTNFKLQGEYFWRQRARRPHVRPRRRARPHADTSSYSSRQSGWYLQGVYQFMPHWRVGARYDRLDPGNVDYGANAALPRRRPSFNPQRDTVMLDYTPSEFSRFRAAVRAEQDAARTSPTTSSSCNTS